MTDIVSMNNVYDNSGNSSKDDTPNYYGGGVPSDYPAPTSQPYGNPYGNVPPQPMSQPQQFGSPYGQPYQQQTPYFGPPVPAPTNKNAIISLVSALATIFFLCAIPVIGTVASIVGIVFGHKALKEIPDIPNSGRGVALAGVIASYFALVTSLVVGGFIALIFIAAIVGGTTGY
jgi:hypothetical protein